MSLNISSAVTWLQHSQPRPYVAMEGLLTPVSTSYRSAAKPIEEPLYVYLHFTAPTVETPYASLPRHRSSVLPSSYENYRITSHSFTDFEVPGL
jgi:hypothetical protein